MGAPKAQSRILVGQDKQNFLAMADLWLKRLERMSETWDMLIIERGPPDTYWLPHVRPLGQPGED